MADRYKMGRGMGKLANLSSVVSSDAVSFVYTPPEQAFGAGRVLLLADMVYPTHPPTGSFDVLATILRGIRRAAPKARIVIVEGNYPEMVQVYEESDLLDEEMRVADVESLAMHIYDNPQENPAKFAQIKAPDYLLDFDCVISAATFKIIDRDKQPLIAASTHNLYGLLPREDYSEIYERDALYAPYDEALRDVYACLQPYLHGAVVDLSYMFVSPTLERETAGNIAVGKVIRGNHLPTVDAAACRVVEEAVPDYLKL
ncbi:MAG: DUF362 domain-containing protein [Aggregatilineales bacterium]